MNVLDNDADARFWERIAEMPYVEAERELRARRIIALADRMAAQRERRGDDVQAFDLLLTRLNDEIHIISQAMNRANVKAAMRQVLDPEDYERVITYMAQMDPRAT